jgi:hypothetical protein
VGHPGGYQMVTSAIVSRPVGRSGDGFLIDGLLNEGTSGSAILAVRGDTEQLEWVGIARAAAVRRESRLVPESEATPRSVSARPYEGRIFLREVEEIRYGIAFAIPMGEIRDFVRAHRSQAAAAGYPLPDW